MHTSIPTPDQARQRLRQLVREGSRILAEPSFHVRQQRYESWKQSAQQWLHQAGVPASNCHFTLEDLPTDLDFFHQALESAGARTAGDSDVLSPDLKSSGPRSRRPVQKDQTVFVVIGRDENVQREIFHFLRAVGLKPLEWSQAVALARRPTPSIEEILDRAFAKAQAILIVLTPDDEARLARRLLRPEDRSFEARLVGQPRPNVIFEAGVALGRNPNRTIVIEIGEIRPISDWAGFHFLNLTGSPKSRKELVERLKKAQCKLDLTGSHWLTAGAFASELPAPSRSGLKKRLHRRRKLGPG